MASFRTCSITRDSVVIFDLPQPFAVVAHDAGAANHIIEWLSVEQVDCRAIVCGPASALWQRRFPDRSSHLSVEEALTGSRAMLTGTGWGSDLEHHARLAARAAGLPTVAVLDHWVNYRMRFERDGALFLPDEIWVTDDWAAEIARREFPGTVIRQKPNAYLERAAREVTPIDRSISGVLFVLEPVRHDWGRGVPGEFQALDYFLQRRGVLGLGPQDPIRLRPHPSDQPGRYSDWLTSNHSENVCMDDSETLSSAISRSRLTVGIQSFALVVADAAGRQAVSALPPWAPPLCLPQPGILELRHLCGDLP
jgi:hypothetical protein